jgi:NAD(P)-dependent dehydrogenase (short-subunit alcohol dehydrogenase family)
MRNIMSEFTLTDVPDQTGKTILVTGANTGIGFDTARVLAEHGARVLLGCRSEDKAREAMAIISRTAPTAELKWIALDLTSLASVASAAEEVLREDQLHALINNAGVMIPPKTLTDDGFELQFGVNHLAHFALTAGLLPKLIATPAARVVNVSSLAHREGHIDYDDPQANGHYNKMNRYRMSKFANILFTYELQRRLAASGSDTISVACHPGISATELIRHIPRFLQILFGPLMGLMNSSTEGAIPTLMAATAADVRGGDYFGPASKREFASTSARKVDTIAPSKDEADAKRLWDLSTELTGIAFEF